MCLEEKLPGSCSLFLSNYCNGLTPDEIVNSEVNIQLCACLLPPQINEPSIITEACEPLCRLPTTISNGTCDGLLDKCNAKICVMTDNVVVVEESRGFKGKVIFEQVCSGCNKENPCICIFESNNVEEMLEKVGIETEYIQLCGDDVQCFKTLNGVLTEVPCPDPSSDNIPIYVYIVILVVIVCIILFSVLFTRRK